MGRLEFHGNNFRGHRIPDAPEKMTQKDFWSVSRSGGTGLHEDRQNTTVQNLGGNVFEIRQTR